MGHGATFRALSADTFYMGKRLLDDGPGEKYRLEVPHIAHMESPLDPLQWGCPGEAV